MRDTFWRGVVGLFLDWCAATEQDWRQTAGQFGRFVYWVQHYDPDVPAHPQVRIVRGARRVNAVLAAVREFFKPAVAIGLVGKAVLDALFELAEDYDLPVEVRGDRVGLRLRSRPRPSISHRSVLAENANLHEQNRRLAQHISDLEDRLSELLGQQAFER
ncbi:MAG TPA: hypothetical protein VEL73_08955, partial [Mycobacteriales bacterium]|nr:hypothetical protein [Mycobacteriales bacterium]